MLATFLQFIEQQHLFDISKEVLLAISGGRDSVAMCELFHRAGAHFAIAHCNFHLRPGDSDRDEAFVRNLAVRYGVTFHLAHFDTVRDSLEWKCSIEETARKERYDFFQQLCQKYHYSSVAVAHHYDDSIETFFINLLRGTGISGLRGIRPRSGNVIRPMLCFSRQDIDAFVTGEKLEYVDDYTNDSLEYRRNFIRHKIVPMFREISSSFEETMVDTMSHLADAEIVYKDAVHSLSKRILNEVVPSKKWSISLNDIRALNPQRTLLFEILRPFGFSLDEIENVIKSVNGPSGKRFYSNGYRLVLERDFLEITLIEQQINVLHEVTLEKLLKDEEWKVGDMIISASVVELLQSTSRRWLLDADSIAVDFASLGSKLVLRHWTRGDRFQPFGMRGTRLISDFFKDKKLTTSQKESVWLLCDEKDRILWVVGLRADDRFKVTVDSRKVLLLRYSNSPSSC